MNRTKIVALLPVATFAGLFFLRPSKIHNYDASRIVTPCLQSIDGREHWGRPNCEGESVVGNLKAILRFNSEGIRDRDYPPRNTEGKTRILLLGSSNIMGLGSPEENTIPRLMENHFRSSGNPVEIINAAMPGYCTLQTNFRLKRLLERYNPDFVIYHLVLGNCGIFDGAWSDRLVSSEGEPTHFNRAPFPAFFSPLNQFIFDHLNLFFFWLTTADQMKKAAFSWKIFFSSNGEAGRAATLMKPTLDALEYMRSASDKKNARLILVTHDMQPFIQSFPSQFYSSLAASLSNLIVKPQVSIAAMLEEIKGENYYLAHLEMGKRKELRIPGDEHLSKEGLQLFAELASRKILPMIPQRKKIRKP